MLPYGYNPANYDGKIWWNEHDEGMRKQWGTQETYDIHVANGGTWQEYRDGIRRTDNKSEVDEKVLKCDDCIWCSFTCTGWQAGSVCVQPEHYKDNEGFMWDIFE